MPNVSVPKIPLLCNYSYFFSFPFLFNPVPKGTECPSLAATCTSPIAIEAVAISYTTGVLPGRGQAKEMGLVPNNDFVAPAS